jgi:hypothetical protein
MRCSFGQRGVLRCDCGEAGGGSRVIFATMDLWAISAQRPCCATGQGGGGTEQGLTAVEPFSALAASSPSSQGVLRRF